MAGYRTVRRYREHKDSPEFLSDKVIETNGIDSEKRLREIMKTTQKMCATIFLLVTFGMADAGSLNDGYIGAVACMPCHTKEYNEWKTSGHALIIRSSSDASINNIPLPAGYTKGDISYVIGGFRWKVLYLDKDGFLIASAIAAKNQYNVRSGMWVDYFPGEKVPYDCGGCHTTGFSSEGHQDGRKGILGTWKFEGVQCEACHGPGALHASSSLKADIKIDKDNCARCHGTRPLEVIPLNGVFLASYTEANQLMRSKMKNLACTDCHNPHLSSEKSIKRSCRSCHQNTAREYEESYLYKVGVQCIDCHMPPAGRVAEGDSKTFNGDLKSHLFRIDHIKDFPVVSKNGQRINPGYLSVDYTCMRCHNIYESRLWAASFGGIAHKIKVTTNLKIMHFQMFFASIGFLFSALSVLSALSLKNWLWPALNKKRMLSLHKHSAWVTFAAYVFVSALCINFHVPLDKPSNILNAGWFLVHIFNGPLGLVVFGGKIIVVRKYRKGWAQQGVFWGIAVFIFWLIQYSTAAISFFNIFRL
jgi:hypothetical protein